MASIFKDKGPKVAKRKRNTFDLSFQNNLTMEFGKLYPVFCKEVLSGDGWSINPAFALNFLPMVYPVQTTMYANLHFFYCRNRAVWPNYKDWRFMTKDPAPEMPYINNFYKDFFKSGSLADYFNIPTDSETVSHPVALSYWPYQIPTTSSRFSTQNFTYLNSNNQPLAELKQFPEGFVDYRNDVQSRFFSGVICAVTGSDVLLPPQFNSSNDPYTADPSLNYFWCGVPVCDPYNPNGDDLSAVNVTYSFTFNTHDSSRPALQVIPSRLFFVHNDRSVSSIDSTDWANNGITVICAAILDSDNVEHMQISFAIPAPLQDDCSLIWLSSFGDSNTFDTSVVLNQFSTVCPFNFRGSLFNALSVSVTPPYTFEIYLTNSANPFTSGALRLSALPFRHYESIYNSYYRNDKVTPFEVNGQIEYNRFVTENGDGADNTEYHFFYRNWEADFLTSCVPTPQQGNAPLVGVTSTGSGVISVDVNGTIYNVIPTLGPDGDTITGISKVQDGFPAGALQQLQHQILNGISINDFRNVNSFQRFLERNLRSGFKYRDLVLAHTGENIHYNELDMPEFIGGVSKRVEMNKILNTTSTPESAALGSFAGLASAFGQPNNKISCHCDEDGFIIGIISVSPVPTYTQSIPKHFLKHHPLDIYNADFARIGMQPVFYSEVSPFERYGEELAGTGNKLEDVFGYQRAFYEYMASVDEAHGLFRTNLRDYVMYRVFQGSPELSEDFLKVDPDHLNDVFAYTEDTDKILGQLYFDVSVKRQILREIEPGLE